MRSRHVHGMLVAAVLAVAAASLPLTLPPPHPAVAASNPQVYWGAVIAGSTYGPSYAPAPYDTNTWNLFEAHAGKKVSILHWPLPWYAGSSGGWQSFPTQEFDVVRSRGAIPFVDFQSWDSCCGTNQPTWALRNIVNGASYAYHGQTFDQYVTSWATAAKAWGHPFFLRFDSEMNGWWQFPWATAPDPQTGVVPNGNTPQEYVAAYQHVHDLFTKVGATNVTWVWCPNIVGRKTVPLSQLYPGNGYVDWTAMDAYNNDAQYWTTFGQLIGGGEWNGNLSTYAQLVALAPTKPIMIAETASTEAGDGGAKKAAWITDAFQTQLPTHFPLVKAVLWFNQAAAAGNKFAGNPYPIESTAAAQQAFKNAIASPYYATNTFGALNTSPIPPLN